MNASRLTRRSILGGAVALAASGTYPSNARCRGVERPKLAMAGVNLAGAEFGRVPGRHGTHYAYPSAKNIDYYARLGFNVIRVPFRWERLQPSLDAEFAPQEQALLTKVVTHATGKGLHVVLDPHNFARRRVADDGWAAAHLIGSQQVPTSAFADFWKRLADVFKESDRTLFGLMNEPAGLAADNWLEIAREAISAIRHRGADNLILLPGVAHTGAHSWIRANNTLMGRLADPASNVALEVHQYFDRDSSGTSPVADGPTVGSERTRSFQTWARKSGFKAFLGEFGAAADDASLRALDDLCHTLAANADVWLGWTAWAGGAWWPEDYMFNLEPTKDGHTRAQTGVLATHAQKIGRS